MYTGSFPPRRARCRSGRRVQRRSRGWRRRALEAEYEFMHSNWRSRGPLNARIPRMHTKTHQDTTQGPNTHKHRQSRRERRRRQSASYSHDALKCTTAFPPSDRCVFITCDKYRHTHISLISPSYLPTSPL